jgi:hypothetical protein
MSHNLLQYIGNGTQVGSAAGIIYLGGRIGRSVWNQVSSTTIEVAATGRILGFDFDSFVKVELLDAARARVTIDGLGTKVGRVRVDGNRWFYVDDLGFPGFPSVNSVALRQEGANTGLSVFRGLWLTGYLDPSRPATAEHTEGLSPDIPADAG